MTDSDRRRHQRSYQQEGTVEDGVAWLKARIRSRDIDVLRVERAAFLGNNVAERALSDPPPPLIPSGMGTGFLNRWLGETIPAHEFGPPPGPSDPEFLGRLFLCLTHACRASFLKSFPAEGETLRLAVQASDAWTNDPSAVEARTLAEAAVQCSLIQARRTQSKLFNGTLLAAEAALDCFLVAGIGEDRAEKEHSRFLPNTRALHICTQWIVKAVGRVEVLRLFQDELVALLLD